MRNRLFVLLFCLAFAVPAMSQGLAVTRKVFEATGSGDSLNLRNIPARRHVLQWWGAGTLTGCSIKVEQSSNSGSSWSDLIAAQTCTSNGVARITTDTSVSMVRITVTALTGGGTIAGRYDGYDPIVLNDAGAGGGGDALVADPLSQFAATTSDQLAAVLTNESGTGVFIRSISPVLNTPNIGAATGSVSGNAGTATALAANGANCGAGNYPLGVDASGAVEGCTAAGGAPGGSDTDIQYNNAGAFGGFGDWDGSTLQVGNTTSLLPGMNVTADSGEFACYGLNNPTNTSQDALCDDGANFILRLDGANSLVVNHASSLATFGGPIAAGGGTSTFSILNSFQYHTNANCLDSAGDAACANASAGIVVIDAGATTVTVSTGAVHNASQIDVHFAPYAETALGIGMCNSTVELPIVTTVTSTPVL